MPCPTRYFETNSDFNALVEAIEIAIHAEANGDAIVKKPEHYYNDSAPIYSVLVTNNGSNCDTYFDAHNSTNNISNVDANKDAHVCTNIEAYYGTYQETYLCTNSCPNVDTYEDTH